MRILILTALFLAGSGLAVAQTKPQTRYSNVEASALTTPVTPAEIQAARDLANAVRCGGTVAADEYTPTTPAPGVVTRPTGSPAINQQRAYTDLVASASHSARTFAESNTSSADERDNLGDPPCP